MTIADHPGWGSVIDHLAHETAVNEIHEWVTGDHWFGYPDPHNPDEIAQATRNAAADARPRAKEQVQRIIDILDKAEQRRPHD